jgi:hypothetical protein
MLNATAVRAMPTSGARKSKNIVMLFSLSPNIICFSSNSTHVGSNPRCYSYSSFPTRFRCAEQFGLHSQNRVFQPPVWCLGAFRSQDVMPRRSCRLEERATLDCCDAHGTSEMGQNPNPSQTLACQLPPTADVLGKERNQLVARHGA